MGSNPVLSVQNLDVSYGSIHALKGLSFSVFPGEIISLIGANGAGKSTTLRAVSGLLPFSGEIKFNGVSIKGMPAHEIVRSGLCHCPEGRGVFPALTVLENLEMGAYFRKLSRSEMEPELERGFKLFPRLKERLKQKAGTLSGGEQQMLAIARALMAQPKLLMLDEPSLGLAPLIVAQIFDIIVELNRSGTPILLVEQNARMALKISHRAYVIETGVIQFDGAGKDLLTDKRVLECYLGY